MLKVSKTKQGFRGRKEKLFQGNNIANREIWKCSMYLGIGKKSGIAATWTLNGGERQ